MPRRKSSPMQAALSVAPQTTRSRGRIVWRTLALVVFLASAAYLAHALWNGAQYALTTHADDTGIVPSMVALPGLGLPIDTELAIALAMLVLFVVSLVVLLATRPRHAPSAPATSGTPVDSPVDTGLAPPVSSAVPNQSDEAASPSDGERHPRIMPPLPTATLPPGEAALLVPPADDPADSAS